MHRYALPVPQRERTLNVVFTQKNAVPSLGHRCLCTIAANHVWRAAHEHQCTRIVIHGDAGHKHAFDTIDFIRRWNVQRLGYWPAGPTRLADGKVPRQLATIGHRALGNTFETTRPTFTVPIDVSGLLTAGAKETT